MYVCINVANEDITCASASVCFLEKNLATGGLVGIEICIIDGLVVGVVADDEYFTFAVEVEIGKADVAISRVTSWRRYGFVDRHGV